MSENLAPRSTNSVR